MNKDGNNKPPVDKFTALVQERWQIFAKRCAQQHNQEQEKFRVYVQGQQNRGSEHPTSVLAAGAKHYKDIAVLNEYQQRSTMKAGLTFFGVGAACFMTFKNKWWTLPIVFPAALYMKYNTFFVPAMKAVPDLVENATSRSYIGNVYCPHLDVLDPLFAEEFREERKKMLDPTYEQVYQELRNACKAYTNKAAGAPEIFTQFPMAPPSARTPEFFSGRNRGEDQGGLAVIKQGDQPPVERPRRQRLNRAGASRKEEDAMVEEEQSLLSWAGNNSNSNSNSKTDLMMADRGRSLGDSRKVGQWNRNDVEDKETAASVESAAAAPRKMTRQELRDRAHSSDE